MKVVVIGATGNSGTSLLDSLAHEARVEEVVGVARTRPDIELPKVRWHAADIARDDLVAVFDGADVVVHLAWLIQPARERRLLDAVNIHGTDRLLRAAAEAQVPAVVVASSVGAYSPGPGDGHAVDESWPTGGIPGNLYSAQKSHVERMLDAFEARHPWTRIVRMRPGLIFQRDSAAHVARVFLGPAVPRWLLAPGRLPVVPHLRGLVTQAVHADDLADAYRRVIVDEAAHGPYNVAGEPDLTTRGIAEAMHARRVPVPRRFARGVTEATWRMHLQPTPGSWVDLGYDSPRMSTGRIRSELGWRPTISAEQALLELADGIAHRDGFPTAPLEAGSRSRGRSPGD